MFNKIRTIGKIVTDLSSKYRKEALKLTKENTAKAGKSAKEAESKIGKEEAQNLGRETKSKMMKDFLRYNKTLKAKGGRIGFSDGTPDPKNFPKGKPKDPREKFILENMKSKITSGKKIKRAGGGRIGFRKGTGRSGVPAIDIKATPTKKLSEKQKKIAKLAGDPQKIDKPDFKALQSRRKNKKVI